MKHKNGNAAEKHQHFQHIVFGFCPVTYDTPNGLCKQADNELIERNVPISVLS